MTMEVEVKKYLLIALLGVGCGGCYREPTDPAQMRQNSASQDKAVQSGMPNDSIHSQLATAGDAQPEDTGSQTIDVREVDLGTHVLTAPDQWPRKKLNSPFLLAEFVLPKSEGDSEDGRLTVSTAGGTVENNVARWKGQFGGTPEKETQETLEVAGLTVTLVDYSGTFADMRGPGMPAAPKAGYRMLGAIIPLGDRLFFVKGYGLAKTVAAQTDQIRAFVQSLKPKESAEPPAAGDPSTEKEKS
jgi:hypothetical protein